MADERSANDFIREISELTSAHQQPGLRAFGHSVGTYFLGLLDAGVALDSAVELARSLAIGVWAFQLKAPL